jgi:hypothetical protein
LKNKKTSASRQDAKSQRKSKSSVVSYAEREKSKSVSRASALKIGPWVSLRLCAFAREYWFGPSFHLGALQAEPSAKLGLGRMAGLPADFMFKQGALETRIVIE